MGDQYQVAVLRGAAEAAASAGANLLCFVGGELPHDPRTDGRHRVYGLCGARNVDGLILLASTLCHGVGEGALARYCERFHPLPVCSVGVAMKGFPSVTVDNEVGIAALIEHLIHAHGARRIAFVRGPKANPEADLRLNAYREALSKHGLAFDERLVAAGMFTPKSGEEAVAALAAIPGLKLADLDAIVASNDAMAVGVLTALERRGIAVPGQMAVVGFDDIEDARLTQPPLTTVRQPFEKMGNLAVKIVVEWLLHRKPPASAQLATEPVVRRSCGCSGSSSKRAGLSLAPERSLAFEAALLMKRERTIDAMTRVSRGSFGAAGRDWATRLLNTLVADMRGPEANEFGAAFDILLEKLIGRGTDLNLCDDVISALREHVVPLLRTDRVRSERAEDLFNLARLATSHALQRVLTRERLHIARWSLAVNIACNAIASRFDLRELRTCVLDVIPGRVGLECCMVVLYEPGAERHRARLLFGYDRALGATYPESAAFDASWLLPPALAAAVKVGSSYVVLPLVWRNECLGHLFLRLDLQRAFAFDALSQAVSIGLHGAELGGSNRANVDARATAPIKL